LIGTAEELMKKIEMKSSIHLCVAYVKVMINPKTTNPLNDNHLNANQG